MNKYYYSYKEFITDIRSLIKNIKKYNPDTLLAISRGGLTLAHFIAQGLNNRRLFSLNSIHYEGSKKLQDIKIFNIPNLDKAKKVLIIDDIIDSGETMDSIIKKLSILYPHCEFKVATIFYKKDAIFKAHFSLKEAKDWIDFFWEVDIL